jgi:hypothetical protein
MARVAVAYVEVRPDLSQFSRLLREKLAAVKPVIDIKTTVDTKGMVAAVSTAQERANAKAEHNALVHAGKMQAINDAFTKEEVNEYLAAQETKLYETVRLAKAAVRVRARLLEEEAAQRIAADRATAKAAVKARAEETADLLRIERNDLNQQLLLDNVTSRLRRENKLAAEKLTARLAAEQFMTEYARTTWQGLTRVSEEETRQLRALLGDAYGAVGEETARRQVAAHNTAVERATRDSARMQAKALADANRAALPAQRLAARFAAEDYAEQYARVFRTRMTEVTTEEARHFQAHMQDEFGPAGLTAARAVLRSFSKELDTHLDRVAGRGAAQFVSRFGTRIQRSGGGMFNVLGLALRGLGGIMNTTGRIAESMFGTVTKGLTWLADQGGLLGKVFGGISGQAGQVASMVGQLAGGLVGASGAAGLLAVALVGAGLAMGTVLAVVIPLVAGITALVAQFVALGGAAVAGLGLLPGLAAAGAAAFGPLMLVADRFEGLLEDTAEHTGELFVVMEKLKNAIWAVMGTGLVQQLQYLAATVLPQLLGGIEAVATAWGRLFTGLARLAGTPAAVTALNTALALGARFTNLMADALLRVAPALLTMAAVATPALTSILDSLVAVTNQVTTWFTTLASSPQFAGMLTTVAIIVDRLLAMLPDLIDLTMAWVSGVLGPAAGFVSLLGAMVDRWTALATSAGGAAAIAGFFTAMNSIIAGFEPLLEQVVVAFLQFGPTLAALSSAALPALQAVVTTFETMATSVAPAVMEFLGGFTTMLADPAVQAAVSAMAAAFGELMTSLTPSGGLLASLVLNFTLLAEQLAPLVDVLMGLLAILVPVMSVGMLPMVLVIKVLGKLLTPFIEAWEWFGSLLTDITLIIAQFIRDGLQWLTDHFKLVGDAVQFVIDRIDFLRGPFNWVEEKTKVIAGWFGRTRDKIHEAAAATQTGTGQMNSSLTALANSKAWGGIANNAEMVTDYLLSMANNGIRGNNALMLSLAKLSSAAYSATGSAEDQARAEARVGRAFTGATGGLTAEVAKTGVRSGSAAGKAFMGGFNTEVATKAGGAGKTAGRKTAAGFVSTFKAALSKLDAFTLIKGNKAFDTGKEIANYLARGITSGAANIAKVSRYIQKNFSKQLAQMVARNKEFWASSRTLTAALPDFAAKMRTFTSGAQLDTYLANWQKHWGDMLSAIQDFKGKAVDALTRGADLVGYFGFIPTPAEVKAQLDAHLARITDFTSKLATLQQRGLSKELAAAWLQAGYDSAGNLVEGLQAATPEQLKAINDQYKAIGDTATSAADAAATQYFGVGEATVQGYINGIASMRAKAGKEMTALIDYVLKQVKAKLGIKSPSTVFAGIGTDTMRGYVHGVTGMRERTVSAMGRVLDALTDLDPPRIAAPRLGRPAFAGHGLIDSASRERPAVNLGGVRVFVGERELTDIVTELADDYDTTRARALLYGRRGG